MALRCLSSSNADAQNLQVQDLALARQHVVLHVQPQHGGQVRLHDRRPPPGAPVPPVRPRRLRWRAASRCATRAIRAALCNSSKCARRDPSSSNRTAPPGRPAAPRTSAGRLMLQVVEAHHHVGHLHAGVVDVVLHLHALRRGRAACARTCRPAWRCAGARCAPPCWD